MSRVSKIHVRVPKDENGENMSKRIGHRRECSRTEESGLEGRNSINKNKATPGHLTVKPQGISGKEKYFKDYLKGKY